MTVTTRTALEIVSVYPDVGRKVRVQWQIDTSQVGLGPFTFTLFRSGSPQGPWDTVASGLSNVYVYDDTLPLLYGINKDVFYQVEASPGNIGSLPRSVLNNVDRKKYLLIRKIQRDEQVMLRKGNGTEVYVIKKRHFGPRCTDCWDKRSGIVLRKDCGTCGGTSFEAGFFTPVKTFAKVTPSTEGIDLTAPTSTPETEVAQAMLQAFPLVSRSDILVEPETNKRWEITVVQPTEILRVPVHQDLTMSRLEIDHPVFKVALP